MREIRLGLGYLRLQKCLPSQIQINIKYNKLIQHQDIRDLWIRGQGRSFFAYYQKIDTMESVAQSFLLKEIKHSLQRKMIN